MTTNLSLSLTSTTVPPSSKLTRHLAAPPCNKMGTKPPHTPETFLALSSSLRSAGPMSSKQVAHIGGTRRSTSLVVEVFLKRHGTYFDKESEIDRINGSRLSACQAGQPRGTVSIKSVISQLFSPESCERARDHYHMRRRRTLVNRFA